MKRAIAFAAIFICTLAVLASMLGLIVVGYYFIGPIATLAVVAFGGTAILAWMVSEDFRA